MDRRQGEPKQSSLPSSLHAHLVTRPPSQEPQSETGAASEAEAFVRRELREGMLPEDLNLRLAPIAPIAPLVAPSSFSSGAAPHTRETVQGQGEASQSGYRERLVRPLPRNRNRQHEDDPHGHPHSPSRTDMTPSVEFIYSSHTSPSSGRIPVDYHFSARGLRNRSRSPFRHGIDPNLSLAPLRIDQGSQEIRSNRGNMLVLLNHPDDHRLPSPSISIGREGFPVPAAGVVDRLAYPPPAPSSLNEPRSAGNENQGISSRVMSRDYQRPHSLPLESTVGQRPDISPTHLAPSGSGGIDPHLIYRRESPGTTSGGPSNPIKAETQDARIPARKKGKKRAPDPISMDEDGRIFVPSQGRSKRAKDVASQSDRRKKVIVACKFCKGRKLRCSGDRPMCGNCKQREAQECEYAEAPRRRGPGKANKGKSKASNSQSHSSGSLPGGHFPPVSGSFDSDPFDPYRQSTMELGALETGSSISTATPPPHTPSTTDDVTRPTSPIDSFNQGAESSRQSIRRQHSDAAYFAALHRQQPKREDEDELEED